MASFLFFAILVSFVLITQANEAECNATFYRNYDPYWGLNHFKLIEQPQEEVQLLIDQSSGSGFRSRLHYESGLFHIKMKVSEQKTGGIIPTFYLISNFDSTRDELDFEFMGTKGLLQTNIYTEGLGGREQRFQLPFDPSQDFHTYSILWNQNQIVFFVDDNPIRLFKNYSEHGGNYPTKAMRMEGTLWTANWAGNVDWNLEPFVVRYQDFNNITACSASEYPRTGECNSSVFFWNGHGYLELSPEQKESLEKTRKSWLVYDYCSSKTASRYPECAIHDQY